MDGDRVDESKNCLRYLLASQKRRMNNLYWIQDKEGRVVRFRMNWAQEEFFDGMHNRNTVLKVRQLGISTLVAIYILDSMLFNKNWRAAIVDKTLDDAKEKVEKIAFAFEHLDYVPEDGASELDRDWAEIGGMIEEHFAEVKANGELRHVEANKGSFELKNGSRVKASTSGRGGTLQFLHVSELGYIAMHDPMRAKEIISGSFNTVGKNCMIVQESTHEGGKFGLNYEQIVQAMKNIGRTPGKMDFKFFFFPWYRHPEYRLEGEKPVMSEESVKYFAELEKRLGIGLTEAQKAWYVSVARTQGSLMRQEYPSTPDEALNPILSGTIFGVQVAELMERGHFAAEFEHEPHRPVYTAWDFGIADYTVIWWIQPDGAGRWFVLDCYTANNQAFTHYIDVLRERDARYGRCAVCVCPHDVAKRDLHLSSYGEELQKAGYQVTRVPATSNMCVSIDHTRDFLRKCVFHARCSEPTVVGARTYMSGMNALTNYRMPKDGAEGVIGRQPIHDESSHASDALRCFADAVHMGFVAPTLGWQRPATRGEMERARSFVDNMLSL